MVAGLDLTIEAGERVLLAGPSGAGKSTVLNALVGALGATLPGDLAGSVEVAGRVGLVPQAPGDAVVAERIGRDVAFGPENSGLGRDEIWARVDAALDAVGLHQGRDHPTAALSGGELQRLALAGVLAMRPDVVLLDEPTAMLDAGHAAAVRDAVARTVAADGSTLVVVEHRIEPWLDLVDRVVVLGSDGSLVADLPPDVFVREQRDALGDLGVWMPGLPAPEPAVLPAGWVRPEAAVEAIGWTDLTVDLTSRSLRGSTTARALAGVSAEARGGRVAAVTGPSGAGKSTLLAALGGLVAPTAGTWHGPGRPFVRRRPPALAADVGWVTQQPEHGFVATTVRDEVVATPHRLDRSVDVNGLLEVLGLDHLAAVHPYRLSGGEQRRLSLATAIAHRPGVVLLDEPTVGQDRLTWAVVVGLATSAAREGAVVATATHDELVVAVADDRIRLDGGRVA